ncbi:snapalysin family zinc-dependent metalloprotease [Streptomyces nanshensis]|uniref:snapalysin family zinc-dependent metalloprotease n=1 Tax=Streptomyces nanshensis TaxID=518642 RepID=UPI000A65A890
MLVRNAVRAALVAILATLTLLTGQAMAAPAQAPHQAQAQAADPVVLTYDAGESAEFADAVDSGAKVWNESVTSVRLEPAKEGEQANIRIVADDGWPRTVTTSLGNGTVYMGREAVDEGHDVVRIASHELGHILGLPDVKPGPCSSLMSGASAGTSCTNANPDDSEKAAVEDAFANGAAAEHGQRGTLVYQD